ncbi:MspA family porin [Nocardia tengchongensis]|uniref:MspA family porin n=1 Tax=Nocardia tengchongensis TaxID=2055889 RepID=UPI0036B6DE3B
MQVRTLMGAAALSAAAGIGLPSLAHAEVITLAPHERTIVTDDGWQVTLRLDDESWNRVAPTNRTGTSREGFGSLHAQVQVSGQGAPLDGAQVAVGYVIGCFVNLNSVNVGGSATIAPSGSLEPGFPVPVIPKGQIGGSIGPNVTASVSPGEIKTTPISAKTLEAAGTNLRVRETHMSIDSCLGPAEVRAYASLSIDSKAGKDSVVVYGDPFSI